jgi:guanine nucleotide-binding protein subunit beta-like protein 1
LLVGLVLAFDISLDGRTAICGSSSEELSAVAIDYASLETTVSPFFKVNQGGISYVRMRRDQRIFATAGWDHRCAPSFVFCLRNLLTRVMLRVRVFHTRKLKPLAILKYHSESVFAVDFTPDSNFLLSASKDHKIALWSIYPPTPETAQQLMRPARQ